MTSFKNLEVWKVTMELLKEIYSLTEGYPKEEMYVHKQQMRKAAVSILGNIAEGFGRFTYADKGNRFTIARGECSGLDAYICSPIAVKLMTTEQAQKSSLLVERVGKLLSGLIASCNNRNLKKPVTSNQ